MAPNLFPPLNELNAVTLVSEWAWMIDVSPSILPAILPAYRRVASFLRNLNRRRHTLRSDKEVELFQLFAAGSFGAGCVRRFLAFTFGAIGGLLHRHDSEQLAAGHE
jgi:hypothetical protein